MKINPETLKEQKSAYIAPNMNKSSIKSVETVEGEPLEHKIERLINNNEPITDGSPEIFTEKKDGVQPGYNIRTDRWEIAAEAMDSIHRSAAARRDAKAKAHGLETKNPDKIEDGKTESTQDKPGSTATDQK